MDKTLIITRIIRPIVKALVRLRCDFNYVSAIMQKEYVYAVEKKLKEDKVKKSGKNYSRIAAITGIDRRFVKKILQNEQVFTPSNGVDKVAEKLSRVVGDNDETTIDKLKEIIKSEANGRYTNTTVIDELILTKRIAVEGEKVRFLSKSLRGNYSTHKYSQLLGESIDICHNTLWHLQNHNDLYHRWDFSCQIHPSKREAVNAALFKLAQKHKDENLKCLASFESTEEWMYPKIGVLQVHFDDNH
jgi:hypothetical protein